MMNPSRKVISWSRQIVGFPTLLLSLVRDQVAIPLLVNSVPGLGGEVLCGPRRWYPANVMRIFILIVSAVAALAADRAVDATYLRRNINKVTAQADELSAPGCQYRPVFGAGDADSRIVRGVARFGLVQLTPASSCSTVSYAREEQIYFVLSGRGQVLYNGEKHPIQKDDFLYLPPGVSHGLSASSGGALDVVVMGYKVPAGADLKIPAKLQIANLSEVKKQVVGNHPPSTLYQLMVGDTKSTRDRLSTGHVITSLFIMEITPDGTNSPHHHDREEEIYLLLDGTGDMVAGGGMDGVEGRHPSKPGDAFFIRLNGTVGFYNTGKTTAHILAIRSLYPFGK